MSIPNQIASQNPLSNTAQSRNTATTLNNLACEQEIDSEFEKVKYQPEMHNKFCHLFPSDEFFHKNGQNIDNYLDKLWNGYHYIQAKIAYGPKFPVTDYSYEEMIQKGLMTDIGKKSDQVFNAFADIVDGSIRPSSPYAVFNMVPNPMLDSIAAASLMQLYNINAIMDNYGGKSLLFEQQVARSLGELAGWDQATGLSCSGGKLTLFYGIKAAIDRIEPNAAIVGIPNDLVILVADGAHYSLEHTCSLLGLGSQQCIRVPIQSSDGMQADDLKAAFASQVAKKKRVAAIIVCGGTTLDFLCEDTHVVHKAVSDIVNLYQLNYFPYLHLDSVIGWLWLSFMQAPEGIYDEMNINEPIKSKINSVLNKFKYIKHFDSFGVDLHKNGLSPYSSSFFISKKMAITTRKENEGQAQSLHYGELKAFENTIENSRSASGIASSWVALQRLGKNGLRTYLAELLHSTEQIKDCLLEYNQVNILNNYSLGWEIIFSIQPNKELSILHSNNKIYEGFYQYVTEQINSGNEIPSISIVKDFRREYGNNLGHGFICYNMVPGLSKQKARELVDHIMMAFSKYEQLILSGRYFIANEDISSPIR
ncbi:glutamate decarboxylase [Iodobacter fluviatilis]|uniref:Glutamate decarboxylase n=1 Tax=Iodobacter fluviatilis TaxID=537 RepID=A0A7G3GB61_9NEIS|nr:glutamate decarboxylase [Iodobacter fluviatilis]QBC44770.1 glutamate decarboxylase [Iodobacter fluviatilis]